VLLTMLVMVVRGIEEDKELEVIELEREEEVIDEVMDEVVDEVVDEVEEFVGKGGEEVDGSDGEAMLVECDRVTLSEPRLSWALA